MLRFQKPNGILFCSASDYPAVLSDVVLPLWNRNGDPMLYHWRSMSLGRNILHLNHRQYVMVVYLESSVSST